MRAQRSIALLALLLFFTMLSLPAVRSQAANNQSTTENSDEIANYQNWRRINKRPTLIREASIAG